MLVLINSRMALGSEEGASAYISIVRFATEPTNDQDDTIELHNGDLAVDSSDTKKVHSRGLSGKSFAR